MPVSTPVLVPGHPKRHQIQSREHWSGVGDEEDTDDYGVMWAMSRSGERGLQTMRRESLAGEVRRRLEK